MSNTDSTEDAQRMPVRIPVGDLELDADLTLPPRPRGLVVFAHGSGSGRHSPRNRHVANALVSAGFATLLMDLLTQQEEAVDVVTREKRFDIDLLAPSLFIVGGNDEVVRQLNDDVAGRMNAPVEVRVVAGATHLFEEAGALDEVIGEVLGALDRWLPGRPAAGVRGET
jgi:fermentation-respiration switch protein FrsA (DUF1100 family)